MFQVVAVSTKPLLKVIGSFLHNKNILAELKSDFLAIFSGFRLKPLRFGSLIFDFAYFGIFHFCYIRNITFHQCWLGQKRKKILIFTFSIYKLVMLQQASAILLHANHNNSRIFSVLFKQLQISSTTHSFINKRNLLRALNEHCTVFIHMNIKKGPLKLQAIRGLFS